MFEKGIVAAIGALVTIIMGFFWNQQNNQKKLISEAKELAGQAHIRITKQAESNNDKFARRDDVEKAEKRIIDSFKTGISEVNKNIRAMNRSENK